mmetsp:Transcript_6573/g.7957  ORF Transcript_6573/g.7957 Transcript_6573/m.7957 type:complete len:446 (-) Transcript_6573:26-1363(-)
MAVGRNSALFYLIVATVVLWSPFWLYAKVDGTSKTSNSPINAQLRQGLSNEVVSSLVQSTLQPPIDIPKSFQKCNEVQMNFQGTYYEGAKVRGCPPDDDIWMRLVHLLMPQAKVFVDIGSNKGFSGARFFALWAPEYGMNPKLLHRFNSKQGGSECGACGDCHDSTLPLIDIHGRMCSSKSAATADRARKNGLKTGTAAFCNTRSMQPPIRVLSFDGSDLLVNMVSKSISMFAESSSSISKQDYVEEYLPSNPGESVKSAWTVELRAFTSSCSPGEYLEFVSDGELGHISGKGTDTADRKKRDAAAKKIRVPCLTLDQLVERENLKQIDLLKIDTEGHDVGVLTGGLESLKKGKIPVILFEYNAYWPEKRNGKDSIQAVIEELVDLDYSCYFEGKNLLVKLSSCMHQTYSKRSWSNIYCLLTTNPSAFAISTAFDAYSLAFASGA